MHSKLANLSKKEVGKLGEDVAEMYLRRHKFKILARNFSEKTGEIDIIARKQGVVHFVEVKTLVKDKDRVGEEDYLPEEQVHNQKLHKIYKTGQVYIMKKKLGEVAWQVDVVAVSFFRDTGKARVKYIGSVL